MSTNVPIEVARHVNVSELTPDPDWPGHFSQDEPGLEQIVGHDWESYRIALIRPQVGSVEHHSTGRPSQNVVILPFTWKQFLTQALKRADRSSGTAKNNSAQFGEVHIDFGSMEVRRSNRLVNLTALEFKVLRFFILNPRKVISRDDLLNQVWGYDCYPCTRTVDNHVLRLRQKLESEVSRPVHFRTVHGVGYKFVP